MEERPSDGFWWIDSDDATTQEAARKEGYTKTDQVQVDHFAVGYRIMELWEMS